jgi:translation initiation factor 3 subunit D
MTPPIRLRFASFSDYLQGHRARESSVVISPQWSMLEEIEFHRLAKLRLEVDEPEDL